MIDLLGDGLTDLFGGAHAVGGGGENAAGVAGAFAAGVEPPEGGLVRLIPGNSDGRELRLSTAESMASG
jgi:hypothetical protein